MHKLLSTAWLALSAILLPTVTAFYPYHYGDDTTPASKSARGSPASSDSSVRAVTLPIRRLPADLRSRQNAFNIVKSNDPKQSNSVAIDQDGGDLSYMVAVTLGDSKKEYYLLMDSAASNTWVMGQDCTSASCKSHNTFGIKDSATLKTQDKPFHITYGTGSVSGNIATDTLHIGSLSSTLTFGLATNVSEEFNSYPMDGILGIGRGVKVDGSVDAPQVMDVLSSNKLIGAKLYGIHLSRNKDNLQDGELNLGEVNKDRFSGDLNWSDCVENETGFWEIRIDNAGVDGKAQGLTGRTAIIDTGTSFILMPQPDAVKLHSQIPGYKQEGETFSVPCDTTAIMQFSFNKQTYNISTADWRGGKLASGLCRSNIIGRQTFGPTQWLVGDVFLKNVYSVFDFDKKRVGLGVKTASQATGNLPDRPTSTAALNAPLGTSSPQASMTSGGLVGVAQTNSVSGIATNPTTAADSQSQGQVGQKGNAAERRRVSLVTLFSVLGALAIVA